MELTHVPLFDHLRADERAALIARAATVTLAAGKVLCYPGDPTDALYVLVTGDCRITRKTSPSSPLSMHGEGESVFDQVPSPFTGRGFRGGVIDPVATLGGLPHSSKVEAITACTLLRWPVDSLWASPAFAAAARRYLAESLQTASARLAELEQPVHYAPPDGHHSAQIEPGPFMFEDVTLIFAFCEADLDPLRVTLPDGLTLFRRPGRSRDALLLVLAQFPTVYAEDDPAARFAYTETTVFVPVRYRHSIGLFVPYIYPSAYEPILLGREIYGFPKQLGRTAFDAHHASLIVDGATQAALTWGGMDGTDEARLVRALFDWLGLEGRSASVAFQAGEVLRRAMQLPPFRRISVYNHKRILAVDATREAPTYAVDQLTHTIMGVLRWYQIARMRDPVLALAAGPLKDANVTLREAYRTQLDMRLTRGRVIRDYVAGVIPTYKGLNSL
ncbi:MAG: acetoacetate decarboxylase family protein [Anaerolineae bacterium]|nr:acetoacetate decarboxylase family protein [Anaerolineae bacterium]